MSYRVFIWRRTSIHLILIASMNNRWIGTAFPDIVLDASLYHGCYRISGKGKGLVLIFFWWISNRPLPFCKSPASLNEKLSLVRESRNPFASTPVWAPSRVTGNPVLPHCWVNFCAARRSWYDASNIFVVKECSMVALRLFFAVKRTEVGFSGVW